MKTYTKLPWIYRVLLVLLVGAIWIFISKAQPGASTSGGVPAPHKGFYAPDFSLPSSTGEIVTLSELRGQPVLVNVWASWCPPCRAEMPAMERVNGEYQAEDFVILAVNSTNQDDPETALAFAHEYGLSFPILFDTEGIVSQLYHVRALPTSFFIDEEGIIQDVVVGGPMSEALLKIRVENLVSGDNR